jgi:hypothetical protein
MGKTGSDFVAANGVGFVMPSPTIKQRPYIVSSGLQIKNIVKITFFVSV